MASASVNAITARRNLQDAFTRDPKNRPEILRLLARGHTRTSACGGAGVRRDTFYFWLETDPVFKDAVERAEAKGVAQYLDALYQDAIGRAVVETTTRVNKDGSQVVTTRRYRERDPASTRFWLERSPKTREDFGANPTASPILQSLIIQLGNTMPTPPQLPATANDVSTLPSADANDVSTPDAPDER